MLDHEWYKVHVFIHRHDVDHLPGIPGLVWVLNHVDQTALLYSRYNTLE